MLIEALPIEGSWVITPQVHADDRGAFLEWFRAPAFVEAVGHRLKVEQANASVSARGVVRGIHFADVPPGQGKYVTCVSGAVLDVVVDVRVGSPTFGRTCSVPLDAHDRRAVYLAEGLGHGFASLQDDSTVVYLCSTGYTPDRERGIDPMDPALGITWPVGGEAPELSAKDAAAPTLAQAKALGLLPTWQACHEWRTSLTGS